MRTIKVHPMNSILFTHHAQYWCEKINNHKRRFPDHSLAMIARCYNISTTNASRYYYGVHHVNGEVIQWAKGYTQMRRGACVRL